MKTWSGWNFRVCVGLAACAVSVATFNLAIDPYSVFGTAEWMRQGFNLNERFRKIEHVRKHIGQHDSFIIGASTMGLFPAEEADALRPGSNWYNLSFLAGTPPEALRALKYLKAQGQPIKEVMFGVDIFAFRKLEGSRETWKREHPLVVGESWLNWYKSHLFASSFFFGIEKVLHNLESPRLYFDVDGKGRYYQPRWDAWIQRDEKDFIKKQIYDRNGMGGKEIQKSGVVLVQKRFDELAELKSWLDENHIQSHFWINPMHRMNMNTMEPAALEDFRSKVTHAIGIVPDYSARTDFTDDDHKFYEWQHFRPTTATLIMKEILQNKDFPETAMISDGRPQLMRASYRANSVKP
jgi:hypothetical protein